jgi:hypothetical protein
MTQYFQYGAYLVGLPLELMVIALLLRGEYQRYPFIFLYVVVDFLTTVIEIPSSLAYFTRTREATKFWAKMFWIDEQILQVLVFLVVISLVYKATEHLGSRRTLLAGIICGTVLVAGISFLVHYYDPNPPPGKFGYMTPWTRDLNFSAAILALGLWALLIGARQKDRKLLLITGALGIQLTGGAIGQALRDMSPGIVTAASEFTVITNLMRLYIWWQVFREKPKTLPPPVAASPK